MQPVTPPPSPVAWPRSTIARPPWKAGDKVWVSGPAGYARPAVVVSKRYGGGPPGESLWVRLVSGQLLCLASDARVSRRH